MSESNDENRRKHRRVPASLLPSLTARLSGGAAVKLLDVSRRGVTPQTALHRRPGQTVAIRFVAADATVTLSAAVVRATVGAPRGRRHPLRDSAVAGRGPGPLRAVARSRDGGARDRDLRGLSPTRPGLDPVVDYTVIRSEACPTYPHCSRACRRTAGNTRMRTLLVALSVNDPAALRAALSAALGTSSVTCVRRPRLPSPGSKNRPAPTLSRSPAEGAAVVEGVARVRQVSKTIPVLVLVPVSARRARPEPRG